MKRTISLVFLILMLGSTITLDLKPKKPSKPVPTTVQFSSLVNEYRVLASKHGIFFKKYVPITFAKQAGPVIGECTWGKSRKIEVDPDWWHRNTDISRRMLLFHELTHCKCSRDHDFGNGDMYYRPKIEELLVRLGYRNGPEKGYYNDGCPVSIMHPVIMMDYCADEHKEDYLKEMFSRCKPY